MKKVLLSILIVISILATQNALAVNKYWVNGTGGWDDATNHWATSTGGLPGAANLPTTVDDVFFDANSSSTSYTVSISTSTKVMRNLTVTAPASGDVTFGDVQAMTINGSITLYPTMNFGTRSVTLNSTTTGNTIDYGGITNFRPPTINGVGGGWKLLSNMSTTNGNTMTITNGTLDLNGYNLTVAAVGTAAGTKTLTLGTSTVTTGFWLNSNNTNFTLNATSSTILINGTTFNGAGRTDYGNVIFANPTGITTVTGSNTFVSLTTNGSTTVKFTDNTTTTVTSASFNGTSTSSRTKLMPTATSTFSLVMTGGGTMCGDFLSISSSTASPANTWYAGANSLDNGGNTGWTFSACSSPATTTPQIPTSIAKSNIVFTSNTTFK